MTTVEKAWNRIDWDRVQMVFTALLALAVIVLFALLIPTMGRVGAQGRITAKQAQLACQRTRIIAPDMTAFLRAFRKRPQVDRFLAMADLTDPSNPQDFHGFGPAFLRLYHQTVPKNC